MCATAAFFDQMFARFEIENTKNFSNLVYRNDPTSKSTRRSDRNDLKYSYDTFNLSLDPSTPDRSIPWQSIVTIGRLPEWNRLTLLRRSTPWPVSRRASSSQCPCTRSRRTAVGLPAAAAYPFAGRGWRTTRVGTTTQWANFWPRRTRGAKRTSCVSKSRKYCSKT